MRPQNKNLKPWQPGQSGNLAGKPKQLLTKDKVSSILGKFSNMTRDELQDVVKDPKSTMLEIMIASVIVKAAESGDYSRLDFLLSRSIGKVKEEIENTIKPAVGDEELDLIPRERLLALISGE